MLSTRRGIDAWLPGHPKTICFNIGALWAWLRIPVFGPPHAGQVFLVMRLMTSHTLSHWQSSPTATNDHVLFERSCTANPCSQHCKPPPKLNRATQAIIGEKQLAGRVRSIPTPHAAMECAQCVWVLQGEVWKLRNGLVRLVVMVSMCCCWWWRIKCHFWFGFNEHRQTISVAFPVISHPEIHAQRSRYYPIET